MKRLVLLVRFVFAILLILSPCLIATFAFALCFGLKVDFASAQSTNGLVSYWPGDGNANDMQDGNHGVLFGSATFDTSIKKVGSASFKFSSVNEYVQVADSTGSNLDITDAITLEAWIYVPSPFNKVAGENSYVVDKQANYSLLIKNDRRVQFLLNFFSSPLLLDSSEAISLDQWHHVAGTYDRSAGVAKVYIDGALKGQAAYNLQIATDDRSLRIGCFSGFFEGENCHPAWNFPGRIDEVKIYNRALSATELNQGYSGLVSYWPFNDSTDTSPDDVLNGNDGTFVGNAGYQGGDNIPPAPGNVDAVELDGSGDYVTVADSPALDVPGSMTISAWVSLDTNKVEHNIVSKDTPANPTNYNLHVFNNRVFFSIRFDAPVGGVVVSSGNGTCDGGGCYVQGGSPFVDDGTHPLGTWRHFAAVYNDATKTMIVYLDGVKDGEVSLTTDGSPSTNNEALQIGKRKAFADSATDGRIDEVKIYNRDLSAQEIARDYTALVSYWPFNDSTDPTPNDVVYGNDGTFVGNAGYQGGDNIPPAPGNVDAVELDGSGDYVTVADSPALDVPGSMTISAWVSLDTNKVEHNIVSKDTPANPTNYNLHVFNNRVFFSIRFDAPVGGVVVSSGNGTCDGGGCYVQGGSPFVDDGTHPLGTWRHFAAVYNDATKTMIVYLDGVKDGEVSLTTDGSPSTNNEALQIGKRKAFADSATDGRIDEVKIYNRDLSAQDIAVLSRVNPKPVIAGPTEICAGGTVVLDAGTGFSSYLWNTGETSQTITVAPSSTTNYSVVVTNAEGLQGSDTHIVAVLPLPTPSITGPVDVCDGNIAGLNAGPGFSSYLWSTGDTTQGITVTPGATITYSVTVTNSFGCQGIDGHTLLVKACPALSINDVSLNEGHSGTVDAVFTVSLSYASTEAASVQFATIPGTATAIEDYSDSVGTLEIPAGSTEGTLTVSVNGETVFEPDEIFTMDLSNPINVTIAKQQGVGMILNDDVTASISDASVIEGNGTPRSLAFDVNLSAPYDLDVSMTYQTFNGSASAGQDYTAINGTLTIPAGSTAGVVSVPVIGDSVYEIDEDLVVQLANPVNVTIMDGQGTGVIANDDVAPSILIDNVTVAEGNSSTTILNFTVTLSKISGSPTSVNFITVDNTAMAGTDFNGLSGTVTIPEGATTATISIEAFGDLLYETNESFFVNLSLSANATIADAQGKGVIENDDVQPSLSVNDISILEGDAGTTNAIFTITLSAPSGMETSVRAQTANDSANFKKDDYVRTVETVTIPPGQLAAEVALPIIGDTEFEPNETFFLNLAAPKNATISDGHGVCTIDNED